MHRPQSLYPLADAECQHGDDEGTDDELAPSRGREAARGNEEVERGSAGAR